MCRALGTRRGFASAVWTGSFLTVILDIHNSVEVSQVATCWNANGVIGALEGSLAELEVIRVRVATAATSIVSPAH